MTSPVTAEQVVDVDTYVVQVHADPTPELLTRLCHDLDRHSGLRALVAHVASDNPEHIRALRELAVVLADTFTWTLTTAQGDTLYDDLFQATAQPQQCQYDEKFSVAKVFGIPMCHGHAAAHDRITEESAS